jgi:hypothetical protein
MVVLSAEVEVRGSGGVKIAEVIEATFGETELPHRSVRTALGALGPGGEIVSPLELEAMRVLRASRTPAAAPSAPADAPDSEPGSPAAAQ